MSDIMIHVGTSTHTFFKKTQTHTRARATVANEQTKTNQKQTVTIHSLRTSFCVAEWIKGAGDAVDCGLSETACGLGPALTEAVGGSSCPSPPSFLRTIE